MITFFFRLTRQSRPFSYSHQLRQYNMTHRLSTQDSAAVEELWLFSARVVSLMDLQSDVQSWVRPRRPVVRSETDEARHRASVLEITAILCQGYLQQANRTEVSEPQSSPYGATLANTVGECKHMQQKLQSELQRLEGKDIEGDSTLYAGGLKSLSERSAEAADLLEGVLTCIRSQAVLMLLKLRKPIEGLTKDTRISTWESVLTIADRLCETAQGEALGLPDLSGTISWLRNCARGGDALSLKETGGIGRIQTDNMTKALASRDWLLEWVSVV